MIFKIDKRSPFPILWHPHQKLWNWDLLNLIQKTFHQKLAKLIIDIVIALDTTIWFFKILLINNDKIKKKYTIQTNVNYFDLGTHKQANELKLVKNKILDQLPNPFKVYAFEANPESYKNVLLDEKIKSEHIELYNIALVNIVPREKEIRLYTGSESLEDSIYRKQGRFVKVPAKKLSSVLEERSVDLSNSINILRMNIEGAELDVINDLINSNMLKHFDGFYGMWDDMSKIDIKKDKEFRKLLKQYNVRPITFNGRDLSIKVRKRIILKSVRDTILKG